MDALTIVAIVGGGAGLLTGIGGLLTGAANWRESKLTNHKLENGLKSTLERIDARTLKLEAWTELHEAQHLTNN
ncbi:MAG TPA: hypothetical protein VEI97_16390 [bacterium]|nr:hypothetical protein [bacterium]